MALWCRNLSEAKVPIGTFRPNRVSVILPFYENHQFMQTQVRQWQMWQKLNEHIEVLVVDDGSPKPLETLAVPGVKVRQFRIAVDVRWNWLAARNIGAFHASGEWLLLTDVDHLIPTDTMFASVCGRLDASVVYAFLRLEHTGERINPHSASFLMTKKLFWKIGGYDEALSGHYGTDGEYRRRISQHAEIQILPFSLVRHEYVGDSSTTRYARKQPQDAAVSRIVRARPNNWKPKTLSFPYHEIVREVPCLVQ